MKLWNLVFAASPQAHSSLEQQSGVRHAASLVHIILILSNQSLLLLLNVECLAEKQQIPIL